MSITTPDNSASGGNIGGNINSGGDSKGDLPFVVDSIAAVQIGSVILRNKSQSPMDSFQDEDLSRY